MNENRKSEQTEETINFKELILSLWDGKWFVLGAAIIFGLIAFIISSYLVPVRYRASAVVTVTVRSTWHELVEKGISQMSRSDQVLDVVYAELGINELEEQRNLEFVAFMEYWGQLELEVKSDDPGLAARAANTWAELVYKRIYDVFGVSEEFLDRIEGEVAQAETNWIAAKNELNEYLSESHLETYPLDLATAKSTMIAYREVIDRNLLIISDVMTLEGQIEGVTPSENLSSWIVLNLINLLGRAGALNEELNLQIQDDHPLNLELSPPEALLILQKFRAALESQNQQLREETAALEDTISNLSSSLEIEQNQVDDLTLKLDLARMTYAELADQLNVFMINKNQVDQSVRISTRALPPTEASNPNSLATAGFAGGSGALLTMLGLLIFGWWTGQDDD